MSRYGSRETKVIYKAGAPIRFKRGSRVKAVKAAATYDALVGAWRAGAIDGFYFGEKSADDKTVIWLVDGVEYAEKDLAGVTAAVEAKLTEAGIVQVTLGDSWVGYQSLTIDYDDGTTLTESYDGEKVVTAKTEAALALAA